MYFSDDALGAVRFDLYDASLDYEGTRWEAEILRPWCRANPGILAGLRRIGEPAAAGALAHEDSWVLYALGRVVDRLTAPHQPAPVAPSEEPFAGFLPLTGYAAFAEEAGAWWPQHVPFHPFLHEIVNVVAAEDPASPPVLTGQSWPGMLVGSMLLARAGVTVTAGRDWLDPQVATTSGMYWASVRRARPAHDLSHGWGSNSQWRTSFRRDYWMDGTFHYNVDARRDRPVGDCDLSEADALDLLRYRCATRVDHGPDVWIWDTHHTDPAL